MSRRRHCANCKDDIGRWPRWCAACWRMIMKTFVTTLSAGAATWLAAHWLSYARAVLGAVSN